MLICGVFCLWLCFGTHLLKDEDLSCACVCLRISMSRGGDVCVCVAETEKKHNSVTTPSLLSALNFSSSTLSQSICTLPVYTRARCLNVTTRSLDARCIHNSGFSLTSSSPLFLPRLLLFSKITWSFGYCFLYQFPKFANHLSAMPSWSFRKRKGIVAGMLHPSGPLSCQGAHWWGTNSSSFSKILCLCVYGW